MSLIRKVREAPIAAANSNCPLPYKVFSLTIVDNARSFDAFECGMQLRIGTADDNENLVMESVGVGERIWSPEVILAVAVP